MISVSELLEVLIFSFFCLFVGKPVQLSDDAEEVAGFYAKMLTHDYTSKEAFNKNFFKDWRKVMTAKERELITDLKKCDFKPMNVYFTAKSEERKNRSKEEKQVSLASILPGSLTLSSRYLASFTFHVVARETGK